MASLMTGVSIRATMLPNACAVCHAATSGRGGRVCEACRARWSPLRHRCRTCALPAPEPAERCGVCLREPPPLAGTIATADYRYPWDGLLQAFKFHDALDLAPALAEAMHAAWLAHGAPRFDLLVPVPLSPARLRERGYNQAAVLARALGRMTQTPVIVDAVLRAIDTHAQAMLPRTERLAHLRGVFAIEPAARQRLLGRRIAIVDDVMTTGATVYELARTLQHARADSVHAWVLARTPP
jgi:ComF family protein